MKKSKGLFVCAFLGLAAIFLISLPLFASPWADIINTPSKRFKSALNGQAVVDMETGLVWPKVIYAELNNTVEIWAYAVENCRNDFNAGRSGWRLPSVEEFRSLLVPASQPGFLTLPAGVFQIVDNQGNPVTAPGNYLFWTMTTDAGDSSNAIIVPLSLDLQGNFTLGGGTPASEKTNFRNHWCVRGGSGYDGGH